MESSFTFVIDNHDIRLWVHCICTPNDPAGFLVDEINHEDTDLMVWMSDECSSMLSAKFLDFVDAEAKKEYQKINNKMLDRE